MAASPTIPAAARIKGKTLSPGDHRPFRFDLASWLLAGLALGYILAAHLLPALLAGLLVHELVHRVASRIPLKRLKSSTLKLIAVALLSILVVSGLIAAVLGMIAFLHSDPGNVSALLKKMAEVLEGSRSMLPQWIVAHIPADAEELRRAAINWLREHAAEVQLLGQEAGVATARLLIGMVLGALVALHEIRSTEAIRPLSAALIERASRLASAFRRIVFAQMRIAALNALFTWMYLAVALPLLGIHLPLVKTMIALTFVFGLLPVIGNLLSNTVIVIVSLSFSLKVAIASLLFLIAIHKLEYFLNARIVGAQIRARAWEILLAMLALEAVFGVAGVVAAPIYYAYLKDELSARRLV